MSRLLRENAIPMLAGSAFLGTVVNVLDPAGLNRVQVRIYNTDGIADQDMPVWARVAVPFAGGKRGAFFIPDVGDEVLVVLLSGDPRFPVVVGSLWNGNETRDIGRRWQVRGPLDHHRQGGHAHRHCRAERQHCDDQAFNPRRADRVN